MRRSRLLSASGADAGHREVRGLVEENLRDRLIAVRRHTRDEQQQGKKHGRPQHVLRQHVLQAAPDYDVDADDAVPDHRVGERHRHEDEEQPGDPLRPKPRGVFDRSSGERSDCGVAREHQRKRAGAEQRPPEHQAESPPLADVAHANVIADDDRNDCGEGEQQIDRAERVVNLEEAAVFIDETRPRPGVERRCPRRRDGAR